MIVPRARPSYFYLCLEYGQVPYFGFFTSVEVGLSPPHYLSSAAYMLMHALRRLGLKQTPLARAQCQTIRLN